MTTEETTAMTTDYPGLDPDWIANYERATTLAAEYARKEGHPGGSDLHRLARSSLTRSRPTADDRKNPEWPGLFRPAADWSDADREEWEAAEERRTRWGQQRRELTAKNAKAESDRVAARDTEVQAKKDAELAALTHQLRRRYLTLPGGTEESFQKALPELLEAHRRRLLTEEGTADDLALAAHRAAFRI